MFEEFNVSMGFFSSLYYKRKLKSYRKGRDVKREFLHLSRLKRLLIAVECNDIDSFRVLKTKLSRLLSMIPEVKYLVYLDEEKVEDASYASDANELFFFKGDLERKITPSKGFVDQIDGLQADVFINLNKETSLVVDFLADISLAKMRVGFDEKVDVSDLVISIKDHKDLSPFFNKLFELMGAMNKPSKIS